MDICERLHKAITECHLLGGKWIQFADVSDLEDAKAEIERLRAELGKLATDHLEAQHRAAIENTRLREELYDATKAGTAYSKEQDSINGLVIDNQNKTVEIERLLDACRDVIAGEWSITGLQEIIGDLRQ